MMIVLLETPKYEAVLNGSKTAVYYALGGAIDKVGDELIIQEITPIHSVRPSFDHNGWGGHDNTGREVKAIITYVEVGSVELICFKVEEDKQQCN